MRNGRRGARRRHRRLSRELKSSAFGQEKAGLKSHFSRVGRSNRGVKGPVRGAAEVKTEPGGMMRPGDFN